MNARILSFIFFFITLQFVSAQEISFAPEFVGGYRSMVYTHFVHVTFNKKFTISNLSLLDNEYGSDKNNIFFIRNTIAYKLHKNIAINVGVGVKNPGKFSTLSLHYQLIRKTFKASYTIGGTYQKNWTLEQSLQLVYFPRIKQNIEGYISFQMVANIDRNEYQRGFQWLRLGRKQHQIIYGLALNFDQWNNNQKTLENAGIFFNRTF